MFKIDRSINVGTKGAKGVEGVERVEGWKDQAKKTCKADADHSPTCPTALSQTRL